MSPLLLAALMIVPVMTACSHTLTDSKGLIYVTSTPPTASSDGSQSSATSENSALESSASADSGTGAKAPKSNSSSGAAFNSKKGNSSSGAAANSKKSGSSSGTGSSSSGGDAVIVPLTESEIISLYNNAVAKNTALQEVEFNCLNTITAGGKKTVTQERVQFNNNSQNPVFDIANELGEIYYNPQAGSVYIFIDGNNTPMSETYYPQDLVGYIMIIDPILLSADVNSCSILNVSGCRVVNMKAVNYNDYGSIYKASGCSGAPISRIDLEYTITGDGFITASCQTFILSDGEILEMDKNYINIGSAVTIRKPKLN
jgi:hypothetical protein